MPVADVLCQPSGQVLRNLRFIVDIIIFGIARIGSDWLHTELYATRIRHNLP